MCAAHMFHVLHTCAYICLCLQQHTSSEPPKEGQEKIIFPNNWSVAPPTAGLASLLAINAVQDVSIHSRQLTSKLHTGSLPVRMGGNRNGQVCFCCALGGEGGDWGGGAMLIDKGQRS